VSTASQQREQVRRYLHAWAGFPSGRDPRPLVLLSPAVRAGPFPADGKAKLAFVRGLIEAVPAFPGEVLHAMRPHPQEAGPPVEPLLVTAAAKGTTSYFTDCGEQQLPAWEVHAQGVPEPIWVLDPGISQQVWRPPGLEEHELTWHASRAELAADQRTVTLNFSGIPRAYANYPRTEVLEAGGAVALLPVPEDIGPAGFRLAHAEAREISVTLPRPLGARVLLDGNGSPVFVHI